MKIKDSFHPYALTSVLTWSLAYVFTRLALQHFSPASLGFLRYFVASLTLVAVVLIRKIPFPSLADWPWFFASGATGFFIYMVVFNKGCQTVTAATSSFVLASAPVVTALLARLIFKEKLSRLRWAAIALELCGVAVLTLWGGLLTMNTGLLWLFAAVLLFSCYNLLQRRLTKTYSGLQTSVFSIFAGTLMLCVFAPATVPQVVAAPPIQLVYILIMGVFSSAIAYVAWTTAFAKAKQASSVGNYMFITPLLTSVLGLRLAGEGLETSTIVGGLIILAGLVVFNLGDKAVARLVGHA